MAVTSIENRNGGRGIISSFTNTPAYRAGQIRYKQLQEWNATDIYFTETEGISGGTVIINDREMINYSSYNYLGLSGHPEILSAAKNAIDTYGTSVSASRIASGEKPVHHKLENAIATLVRTESAMVIVGGFSTNESVIGHIMTKKDLIVYDSYSHESIQRGSQLSGAIVKQFPHNSCQALDSLLERERGRYEKILIVIEGVYSMDGDIPDLPEIIRIKKKHKALLMVDEAHSMGVIGKTGRGVREYFNVDVNDVDLWMGTLSKAFASQGGYIAGKDDVIKYLKYTTPGFVYSAGMTPPDAAAALEAINVFMREPELVERLQKNSNLLLSEMQERGWNTGSSKNSPVIPLILGDSEKCISLYHKLFKQGIFVIPVIHPFVPRNASRLRFFVSASHTEDQIYRTVNAIEDSLQS